MPEFKIVISDPEAKADSPVAKVKIKGDENIEYGEEEKSQRKLPVCKANPKLIEKLGAVHNIITVRIKKEEKKIKHTCKVVADAEVPEDEVRVSLEWLGDAAGVEEAEGEVFRAKAWQITVASPQADQLIGLKIGDTFDGEIVGLSGYKLKIRGGSDNSGFPMLPSIPGPVKKRVLLSGPPGFHPREKGERRRKTVRGNTITHDIVQINTVIVYPEKK
ncbi:30S ribosomal protein S6e [Pyrodictium delaneyi]|uniref:Small ribosomal subunit protein eS6 n=1 Tax=Pyrodictium delaneyi TaxID=1273541 RepID=A0A0P0N0W8_9CREN|nr:30S ribosomal protein S6e [Pyrodictium delaneyi]ALL00166.1 30S ribosomal protein S6e [Pyrodictium delaneyi]OWJ54256.1 30S ribosomal protein S6e [Pyrodictium delaneyi]